MIKTMVMINPNEFAYYDPKVFEPVMKHFVPVDIDVTLKLQVPANEKILCSIIADASFVIVTVQGNKRVTTTYTWATLLLITKSGVAFTDHNKVRKFYYWNKLSLKFHRGWVSFGGNTLRPSTKNFINTENPKEVLTNFSNFCKFVFKSYKVFLSNMRKSVKDANVLRQELNNKTFDSFLSDLISLFLAGYQSIAIDVAKNTYQFITDESKNVKLFSTLAYFFRKTRNFKATVECYDQILQLDPANNTIQRERENTLYAHSYYQINSKSRTKAKKTHNKALKNIIKAREFEKKDKSAKAQKKYDKSLDYLSQVIELDPYNIEAWEDYKNFLVFLGKLDEANLREQEKRNYTAPEGYNFFGFVPNSFKQDDYEKDLKKYQKLRYYFKLALNLV
ncbi:MAG: hypothetical protein BAJALOKI1v1_870018 [Promethearchaeota archaeon]|nr:MAG: hypothetical protein BAJALOKI1v1_870018 [Candidatus Lokiarchaeota archaeon]